MALNKQYKKDNERYLIDIAKEDGVMRLDCGVLYKIIEDAGGPKPRVTSQVIVEYEGRLIDGTVFDSTYSRRKPSQFRVADLIKGWREAIKKMPCGSTWEIYIPHDMGYGTRNYDKIPAYSTLIFKVSLLDIR